MKKILAFAGSNSSQSINRQLVIHAGSFLKSYDLTIVDLNDYEMPIYSADREKAGGFPAAAHNFKDLINDADGIVISFAEHNGSYSVAFKNIMDWVSRLPGDTWGGKTMLLMATSPGKRGGQTVLQAAASRFPFMGAKVTGTFSLPSFGMNFSPGEGIIEEDLRKQFTDEIVKFQEALDESK